MHNIEELTPLIQPFAADDRDTLNAQVEVYNALLRELLDRPSTTKESAEITSGILALNGASGAGQSYVHYPEVMYSQDEIYYYYQSRPGAANAILMDDVRAAMNKPMYLETVIPTLLHIKTTRIGEVPAWGHKLKIVYLATPSGQEWLYRLLNREPSKLESEEWRAAIMGRVNSSIGDMEQAVEYKVQTVLNWHGKGEQAAREILTIWGLS